jgi:hypothetical protein
MYIRIRKRAWRGYRLIQGEDIGWQRYAFNKKRISLAISIPKKKPLPPESKENINITTRIWRATRIEKY